MTRTTALTGSPVTTPEPWPSQHIPGNPVPLFPQIFESVVNRVPDLPAVVFEDCKITYAAVNQRANKLARLLISRGVGPEVLVAIAIPRSIDLIVALLGVLKASGAYLPIDPTYPAPRVSYMLADARPSLVLRAASVSLPDADIPEIVIDDDVFAAQCTAVDDTDLASAERGSLSAENLMYVIYTSGSTGTPKGVAVSHAGVMDVVGTQSRALGAGPGDRVLQWASISFDAAFWDICLGLLSGAALVMAPSELLLPGEPLQHTLRRYTITHATLPPVALSSTVADDVLDGATIISTGDAFTPALARQWCPGRRVFNGYGPTELTIGATLAGPISAEEPISIGAAWHGKRVDVLDDRLRPVGDGTDGELYLAGVGLARGYLNRAGQTAATFVADPKGPPGSRMYRSGDKGREVERELYFTGRGDDQVKLRGFRVELGEIEACLATHPSVELAVVTVHGALAEAVLVAYVTTPAQVAPPNERMLRDHVAKRLPQHMVPASVLVLDRLPTTPNGKIDRRALPVPQKWGEHLDDESSQLPTDGSGEQIFYRIVAELVSIPVARPADNLFELGGNSLTAARLGTRVRKQLGVQLPIRTIMEARTLADLAAAVATTIHTRSEANEQ
ncbi:non-ribosomal peptide synthetase [Nocardia sp. NPDC005998]|uniref:non-ribosomal peptide synthetase n=1 Tax=Nocardia sp. NPDC005998 TaxID=3156894 RepID=UPI0033B4F634